MNVREYNRAAWDKQVESGNRWTVPVTRDEIAAARSGEWHIPCHQAIDRQRSMGL